ncbi:MAG: hypothetical protein PF689_01985 [Deltaproteobacteria bacterium]|jgi:hypothetical protein|nr:hypothetical protein [Deltaproteobacteria bacterium]
MISVFGNFFFSLLLASNSLIQVIYPQGVLEYEKFWQKMKKYPSYERVFLKNYQPDSKKKSVTFGPEAARKVKSAKNLELFIAGRALRAGHSIFPRQADPQNWVRLFSKLNLAPGSVILILSSPRLKAYTAKIAAASHLRGIKTKTVVLENRTKSFKFLIKLYKNPQKYNCGAVFLAHDLQVFSARILGFALKIQYSRGIPLFVRTKHEVLAGGFATVEADYAISSKVKSGSLEQKLRLDEHVYINSKTSRFLLFEKDKFQDLNPIKVSK